MADLKTTNIYGDAYINNKVGIATNAPATRLQIGQLSPTAATEGIQFGDDTSTRLYRSSAGTLTLIGGFAGLTLSASTALYGNYGDWSGESNKIQWHSNNLYFVNRGGGSWLFRNSGGSNVVDIASNGTTTVAGNISAANLSGTNTGDQTVGNGTITIAAGTGISVASNTFTTNQTGNSTVTVTNSGVTSNVAGTGITVSGATGAVTITNSSPNATHTGDVTGATALTIANDAVTTVKILNANVTNAKLANSSLTIGSTAISLGATATTIAGLTSVTSTTFVGALTGNASTATSADNIDGRPFVNTNSNSATNADSINSNGISYYTGGVTNFSGNATDGGLYSQAYSNDWQHQIAGDYRSGQIALRGKNSGTWQSWRRVLDDTNSPYALNMNQYVRTTDSPTFAGLSLTSVSTTGATITNLTGAYQNTTVYDSPKTQSATPSRGIRAPASSIQFTNSYAIAPFWTYRSTGDWPVPYGIGWGTGGESSGIFQRYASNGSSFGDMIFYTGNDGSGAFSFRRHTWEGTTHFAAGSGELNTELFRIDWSGNLTMLGTLNGSANSATLYANNASYGSWRIGGTRNGWYGIEFESGTNLMANSNEVGFHRNGHGWQFWWSAGTGYVHKGNPGGGTQATILDSSNASNAWNMNQNVRTTDSPTFGTLQLTRLNFGATGATPYTSAAGEGTGNGITFGGDEAGPGYRIFTTMENVGGNYSKLVINWHTGIRIGAYTNYGGVRFYNNAFGAGNPTPSEIFSIGNTDSNVRVVNNLIVNGITLNQERSSNARIYGASAGSMGLLGVDSAAAFRWQIYGESGNYGFLDSTWGNWDIRKAVNGELDLRVSSALVRVLNSGNASFAYNMNQNVRTTDNVTFGTVTATSFVDGGLQSYGLRQYTIDLSSQSSTNFYPVVIDNPPGIDATWHNQFSIDMVNQGGGAAYNMHSMYGEVRGQGWTDQNAFFRIFHNFYDSAERSILGVYRGTQAFYAVVVYLRGGKNYYVRTNSRTVVGYSAAQTLGNSVFAIKDVSGADVSGTSSNISQLINLVTNPSGFYHSDNAYIGTNQVLHLGTTSSPNLSIGGNAATATTLQTARNINGTSFNGSAAITTATWGTARTLTIGSTGKSVDGSAAITWSLAEIGAAATNQTMFIGTTSVAINRASSAQTLTGISIDGNAATVTNGVYTNTNNTLTGINVINNTSNTLINNLSGNLGLTMFQATAGTDAYMTFHIGGDFAAYLGLGGAENDLVYGGWSAGNNRHRILHSGNASFAWNMNQNVRTTDNVTFGTVTAALSGNAATATTLQTARAINGVSFNGSAAITVNGLNYNVNNDWLRENGDDDQFKLYGNSRTMIYRTDGNTNAHGGGAFAHIFYYGGSADANRMFIINTDGRLWSPYHGWLDTMSISGNAATATTLQTARNINGTSFNGSAAITTATWGTARTITIGSTGKSVDGSANVSWTLAEIGAAATNQTMFIGTTSVAINRASAAISLAGTSIDGTAGGLNSSNYISRIGSSGNYNTDFQNTPAGTVRHQGDDANITNTPGGTWWFVDNYRHSNASNYWGTQVAWGWEDNANKLATRNITGNSFGSWVYYLNSVNYTDYTVTKTGTGASGTWGINITGNAATATTATNVTIANGSVTLAKIENITAYTILGNSNASAAATPAALSVATVATMLSGQTMNINGSSTSCSGTAANATTAGGLAVHTGTNNEANKIVRTQGNGYIMAGWINTISGDNGTTAIDRVYASSDGYIRYYTPANFRTVLDVPTRAGSGASGNWAINITGNAATATTATTAGALTTGNTYTIAGLTSNGTINIFPTYADSYSYFLRMGYDNSGNYDYTVKRNGTTGFLEFNGTQTNYVAYYFAVSGASGIGIGVSPAARLHINGDGTNPPIRIDNPALGSGASNSRSFHGWLPISIGGTTKYIQLYN